MRKIMISAAVVATSLAVGACAGVRVNEAVDSQNYYDGAFEYATQSGWIKTVVLGSPFEQGADTIAAKTTAYMTGATRGRTVTFQPTEWSKPDDSFRVVVLFNGKMPFDQPGICKNGANIASEPGRTAARMDAVFCQGEHLISSAEGYADGLKGPDDPRFRDLVRSVALGMIPAFDHNQDGSDPSVTP